MSHAGRGDWLGQTLGTNSEPVEMLIKRQRNRTWPKECSCEYSLYSLWMHICVLAKRCVCFMQSFQLCSHSFPLYFIWVMERCLSWGCAHCMMDIKIKSYWGWLAIITGPRHGSYSNLISESVSGYNHVPCVLRKWQTTFRIAWAIWIILTWIIWMKLS
jgi:hypothetical protein